jgi:hypothetical protein
MVESSATLHEITIKKQWSDVDWGGMIIWVYTAGLLARSVNAHIVGAENATIATVLWSGHLQALGWNFIGSLWYIPLDNRDQQSTEWQSIM